MKTTIAGKITLINQVVLECVSAASEKEIISKFIHLGIDVLRASYGFSWYREHQHEEFKWLYKSPGTPYTPSTPRKQGVMSQTFRSISPRLINDVAGAGFVRDDAKNYMKSVAVIPVRYRQHRYGTLVICFNRKRRFNSEDSSLCSYLGNAAAQAITIYRLYANLRTTLSKIEHQKARDEALLSSIGDGIIASDRYGRVFLFNAAAEAMLGWRTHEVLGKQWFNIWQVCDEQNMILPQDERPMHQAIKNGRKVMITSHNHYFGVRKDGKRFPVSITASPIIVGSRIIGGIIIFRDISIEKEIDRAKTEFVSLASHQLRTPTSIINWYTEMLEIESKEILDEEQKGYIREIYKANTRMIELVNTLLNVSRIEMGTFPNEPVDKNILDIAESVLHELEPEIERRKLKLERVFPQGPLIMRIDPRLIRILFQNLLSNAVKYTSSNGRVTLTLEQQAANVFIKVSDTGCGIPQDAQPRIFTKMFRADNVRVNEPDGTGLGLYIVKAVVDRCEGRIWFDSEENKGTSFYIALPMQGLHNPNASGPAAASTYVPHAKPAD